MSEPIIADKQTIVQIFDGAAETYDRAGPSLFRQFGARLVELMDVPAGARVLDVGTGTGAILLAAAQRVGPGGQVVGIDVSNEMLGEANRAASAAGLSNAQLGRMDAEYLEFPDHFFDAVTCGFALFFASSMPRALREMRRVLRPGGLVGVSLWGKAPFDPAWKLFAEQVRKYEVEVRMPQKVAYSPEEAQALLSGSGFAEVQLTSERAEVVYATEEDWWAFQLTNGSRGAVYMMPEETRAKFKEEYLAQLRPLFRPEGLVLPAPVVYAIAKSKSA